MERLNAEIDAVAEAQGGMEEYPRRLSGELEDGSPTPLGGDPSLDPQGRPEGRHRMDLGGFLSLPQPSCEPFRELLCHGSVKPYLDGILGSSYRLDHGPGLIAMEPGAEGGTLHGGGFEITDFSEQYMFKNGRIYTGLTVVEYMLADEGPGDGGL